MGKVLIVDDHPAILESIAAILDRARIDAVLADTGAAALDMIGRHRPDAVLCDLNMPHMDGLELLQHVRLYDPQLPVTMLTGHATVESAVGALRHGAFDYLLKPIESDTLVRVLRRALRHRKLITRGGVARRRPASGAACIDTGVAPARRLVGQSAAMRRVRHQIQRIAASHGTVLITGESGTGKEIVAQMIHAASPRRDAPMLCLNCAALSTGLLESELFGHEKGAFTGADQTRSGRFELAHGGTLLLDEVSEISPAVQAKLLRVMQERQFERVGSSVTMNVDVRVVATTNRDLGREVESGGFRRDLYYRVNVLPVHLPPLRDRRQDVPELAAHFLDAQAARDGRSTPRRFSAEAMAMLCDHAWPGNVRELENLCERAAVLAEDDGLEIDADLIEPWLAAPLAGEADTRGESASMPPSTTGRAGLTDAAIASIAEPGRGDIKTIEQLEREAILRTLARFNGHRQRTADALGIGVRTLGLKLKKWKELRLVAHSV
ncbi:MAG: response regulator [Phycisphaera sp.]|nr:response regulator [Phycisphaera sp.]